LLFKLPILIAVTLFLNLLEKKKIGIQKINAIILPDRNFSAGEMWREHVLLLAAFASPWEQLILLSNQTS